MENEEGERWMKVKVEDPSTEFFESAFTGTAELFSGEPLPFFFPQIFLKSNESTTVYLLWFYPMMSLWCDWNWSVKGERVDEEEETNGRSINSEWIWVLNGVEEVWWSVEAGGCDAGLLDGDGDEEYVSVATHSGGWVIL
ncbi:hypothetical protein RYX36_007885 [Vicia faba]